MIEAVYFLMTYIFKGFSTKAVGGGGKKTAEHIVSGDDDVMWELAAH